MSPEPIRVAIADDYELVVRGVAHMLQPFADRVVVVELDVNRSPSGNADIVLYDTFAVEQGQQLDTDAVLARMYAEKLVVYSWQFAPDLVTASLEKGASGYVHKSSTAEQLVDALHRVHTGETVVFPDREQSGEDPESKTRDWPGRSHGLAEREAEVIALITQGLSNQEVADRAYLSINTVKSYIRSAYQKIGVTSRTQAVLWGVDNGFRAGHQSSRHRVDDDF